jgi:hypothetical protein
MRSTSRILVRQLGPRPRLTADRTFRPAELTGVLVPMLNSAAVRPTW